MARRTVQYGVVNASNADVGAGAPGFRATWHSPDDLRQQVLKISDVPNNGKLYFWDGELWLRWDDPDDLPGPEGDPLRIKIVCPVNTGILLSFCACRADSRYAYACFTPKHIRCKKISSMLLAASTCYVLSLTFCYTLLASLYTS